MKKIVSAIVVIIFLITACHHGTQNNNTNNNTPATKINVPAFNEDSAYNWVAKQVSFGPRIPNTPAHKQCAEWLINKMQSYADTTYVQHTTLTAWDKSKLECYNIIGTFNPAAKERILILAHWDTRPFSDQDKTYKTKPFDGADDGGSGVAVILEAAHELSVQKTDIGVDLLLVDDEDYGKDGVAHSFCLGTQYWAAHPHVPNYAADYGICLDMVGAKNAHFYREGQSLQYAAAQMKMFWDTANELGYSDYFRYDNINVTIEDDHQYVNEIIHIPSFDVINLRNDINSPFPAHWHTQQDNMSIISKNTLKAVGQTLLQVLYTHPAY